MAVCRCFGTQPFSREIGCQTGRIVVAFLQQRVSFSIPRWADSEFERILLAICVAVDPGGQSAVRCCRLRLTAVSGGNELRVQAADRLWGTQTIRCSQRSS